MSDQPEVVQQLYDTWGNRASLKEPEAIVDGERVFRVGEYSVTVPNDVDQPAKVANIYRKWGASENPMPNLSFSDGEMRIPVEDFVDLILRRVPADELAEGLWRDAAVRERFVYCMANRYGGDVDDGDRRKLLNEIQVAIHAVAIDRAIERLNHLESNARAYSNHHRWRGNELGHYTGLYERYQATLNEMRLGGLLDEKQVGQRLANLTTPDQLKVYHGEIADPVVRESVGPEWRESRDYWRAQLAAFFAEPCDNGSGAEREDSRSEAEAEGPQSGGEAASPKPSESPS